MSLLTSGWLSQPVGAKFRVRRSTVVLLVAFFSLTALYLQIRTIEVDTPEPVVIVTTTTVTPTTVVTLRP